MDQVLNFLRLHNVTRVGLEATGGYEKLCAYTLLNHGFKVYVIQPRWVREYAKSLDVVNYQLGNVMDDRYVRIQSHLIGALSMLSFLIFCTLFD
ncbi:MAG: hypothetical protein ACEY3B_02795 [Wolbachia sp.]